MLEPTTPKPALPAEGSHAAKEAETVSALENALSEDTVFTDGPHPISAQEIANAEDTVFTDAPHPDSQAAKDIAEGNVEVVAVVAPEPQTVSELETALVEATTPEPVIVEVDGPEVTPMVEAAEVDRLDAEGEAEALAFLKASHGFRLIDVLAEHSDSHLVREKCRELRAELVAPFQHEDYETVTVREN